MSGTGSAPKDLAASPDARRPASTQSAVTQGLKPRLELHEVRLRGQAAVSRENSGRRPGVVALVGGGDRSRSSALAFAPKSVEGARKPAGETTRSPAVRAVSAGGRRG